MNINKINIKCIIILSAIILLLCIICAILTLDNHNKANKEINHTTVNITQPQIPTQQTHKQTEAFTIATAPTSTPTTSIPTTSTTTTQIQINSIIEGENSYTSTTKTPSTPTAPTANNTTNQIENQATEQATAITEAPTVNDEELLKQIIAHSGYNLSDIKELEAKQLIIVTDYNSSSDANAKLFSFNDDKWQNEQLDCKVYVGNSGIGNKTNDSDNITPKGLYTIGEAFYIDKKPSTWLNTFKITNNTYWITDTNSDMYNKKIELENTENTDNGIHMINSTSYRYGCIINYNTDPVINGKGCAIFMECGDSATNGSVAFNENDLLKYLEILNSEKNPAIIIF